MDKIRRVNDLEKAMEQVRHRIRTNEKELSDAWSQINRNGWILVGLVIVCSALIGALF
jgi:predicted  nucleic acid-binding Zn-ribbon protein|tara:strand:- start:389 stop:562 length:174 start_codon:yes stop_codon:yes gene_type:complete